VVYVQEVPSSVHTITGVATSISLFIGRAMEGPVNEAVFAEPTPISTARSLPTRPTANCLRP